MIIWSGWGLAVLLMGGLGAAMGVRSGRGVHPAVRHSAAASALDGRAGTHLHRSAGPAVNQETGQQVCTHPRSTFFFLSVPLWVGLMFLAGLGLAMVNAVQLVL